MSHKAVNDDGNFLYPSEIANATFLVVKKKELASIGQADIRNMLTTSIAFLPDTLRCVIERDTPERQNERRLLSKGTSSVELVCAVNLCISPTKTEIKKKKLDHPPESRLVIKISCEVCKNAG